MFVIRTFPRSGTHMLRTALDSHSQIKCLGELFHVAQHSEQLKEHGAVGWLEQNKLREKDGFVAHGYWPDESGPFVSIYHDLWQALRTFRPPIISLQRRDLFRRHASALVAAQSNRWRREQKKQPKSVDRVEVRVGEFTKSRHAVTTSWAQTAAWFPWSHIVWYEDLVTDWDNQMQAVQEYLGIPVEDVRPRTLKQDTRPIAEIISNWDEIKHKLDHPEKVEMQELIRIAEEGHGREEV